MSKKIFQRASPLVAVALMAFGCVQAAEGGGPTSPPEAPPATETSVPPATQAATPTASPLPTRTRLPPTPPLLDNFADDFFFGGSDSDCELPCWRGLRVGTSTRDDVQTMFDTVFGFSGSLYPVPYYIMEPPPGYQLMFHEWSHPDSFSLPPSALFSVFVLVDEEQGILQQTHLFWGIDSDFEESMSIQNILRELGVPSYMFVKLEQGGQGSGRHVRTSFKIVYASGMLFSGTTSLAVNSISRESDIAGESTQLCLENIPARSATISEPLVDGLNNLSPVQRLFYGGLENYSNFQDVFGISLEELTQLATDSDNPCIETTNF